MILFPAIDLRHGRVVRLRRGDPNAETVFGDDPAAIAQRWATEGATWLHVVNLDGALEEEQASALNLAALERIVATVPIPIQFGGGLRSLDAVARVLEMGVTRVVLGTVALRDPRLMDEALQRYGAERIVAGLDAREGRVAIRGWQETTPVLAVEWARRLRDQGVQRAIYTDIGRDGMLSGPDLDGLTSIAQESGLRLIASGGIARLQDLQALQALGSWLEGAILGQALYTGAIALPAALSLVQEG